jgi:hypothetical protein
MQRRQRKPAQQRPSDDPWTPSSHRTESAARIAKSLRETIAEVEKILETNAAEFVQRYAPGTRQQSPDQVRKSSPADTPPQTRQSTKLLRNLLTTLIRVHQYPVLTIRLRFGHLSLNDLQRITASLLGALRQFHETEAATLSPDLAPASPDILILRARSGSLFELTTLVFFFPLLPDLLHQVGIHVLADYCKHFVYRLTSVFRTRPADHPNDQLTDLVKALESTESLSSAEIELQQYDKTTGHLTTRLKARWVRSSKTQRTLAGNLRSKTVHSDTCPAASAISIEDKFEFTSLRQARRAGFRPHKMCLG